MGLVSSFPPNEDVGLVMVYPCNGIVSAYKATKYGYMPKHRLNSENIMLGKQLRYVDHIVSYSYNSAHIKYL